MVKWSWFQRNCVWHFVKPPTSHRLKVNGFFFFSFSKWNYICAYYCQCQEIGTNRQSFIFICHMSLWKTTMTATITSKQCIAISKMSYVNSIIHQKKKELRKTCSLYVACDNYKKFRVWTEINNFRANSYLMKIGNTNHFEYGFRNVRFVFLLRVSIPHLHQPSFIYFAVFLDFRLCHSSVTQSIVVFSSFSSPSSLYAPCRINSVFNFIVKQTKITQY